MWARGRSATARTAAAMFSSPTSAIVSTEMRSPRRLCRSLSDTAPSATCATWAPPPTTMTRLPKIWPSVGRAPASSTPGTPATTRRASSASSPRSSMSKTRVMFACLTLLGGRERVDGHDVGTGLAQPQQDLDQVGVVGRAQLDGREHAVPAGDGEVGQVGLAVGAPLVLGRAHGRTMAQRRSPSSARPCIVRRP